MLVRLTIEHLGYLLATNVRRSAGKFGTAVVGLGFSTNNIRAAWRIEEFFDVFAATRRAMKE